LQGYICRKLPGAHRLKEASKRKDLLTTAYFFMGSNNRKDNSFFFLVSKTSWLVAIFCCSILVSSGQTKTSSYKSQVWISDNGDGTYKNPVLHSDYSDPDAIRVGDDYYLTASSFNCTPGLPILHSNDLVNWRLVNYALKKQVPFDVFDKPQHGKGVWAPAIRFHNGEFYIYYPDPDFGIYMIKTKNIAGEWTKPLLVLAGKGYIDPCPLWDEDGKTYLVIGWAGSRAGVNSMLTIFKMNSAGTEILDEGKHVFDGHDDHRTVEGPKLYKRHGYYYIFAPAGGVATGWQLILRSKNIYGPYEEKIVLDQGSTLINGPHQGAWVDTKTGENWFLHFQDKDAYGRVLHLQPMSWKNDWPVIGVDKDGDGKGEPVMNFKKPNVGKTYKIQTPPETDEFNTDTLGLQWQWHTNPKLQWSALIPGKSYLRLMAVNQEKSAVNLWPAGSLLLQKFPAPDFTVTTKMNFHVEDDGWENKKAGLIIMGIDYSYLSINKNAQGYYVTLATCKDAMGGGEEKIVAQKDINSSQVYFRVNISAPDALCAFSFSEDGINYSVIGDPFKPKAGRWIGAKVGLFCNGAFGTKTGGYADVDWFRVTK
jgi:beta-xylosidase